MCGASTLTDLAADIKKSVALHPRSFVADLCLSLSVTDLLAQGAADGIKMSLASFQVLELFAMSCPFMAVEGLGKENIPQEKSLITDLNSVPTPAVRRCCCCSFLLTAHRGRFCFQLKADSRECLRLVGRFICTLLPRWLCDAPGQARILMRVRPRFSLCLFLCSGRW